MYHFVPVIYCYLTNQLNSMAKKSIICLRLNRDGFSLFHLVSCEVTHMRAGRSTLRMAFSYSEGWFLAGNPVSVVSWVLWFLCTWARLGFLSAW